MYRSSLFFKEPNAARSIDMDLIGKLMNDDDLLKVAAVAFILWRDKADYKLLLVLAYVFLLK